MTKQDKLITHITSTLTHSVLSIAHAQHEVTVECDVNVLIPTLTQLRDDPVFAFDELIDLSVVDYLMYGVSDWETTKASEQGFSRGVEPQKTRGVRWDKPRFAVVYHLLSTTHNHRLRLKVFVDETYPVVASAHCLWKGANWFEREAYDLFGILFEGHPDLRRILTDYGFIGHPFRKDFPLSGHVEMRYDATLGKVIYEPVDIEPRLSGPKVIRDDNRYRLSIEGVGK